MVNNSSVITTPTRRIGPVTTLVAGYAVLTVATIAVLAILSSVAPEAATSEAWGHAVVVAVFAALLLLRLRSARAGSTGALRAVGIIAAVLMVANLVEAALPHTFPTWMRIEMLAIAALMAVLASTVYRLWRSR